uniref:Uncharacterized protein n=1 Tax=Octopus bimaculoides TaxID=37653 RepID=A0A0L8HLT9_OCTBM
MNWGSTLSIHANKVLFMNQNISLFLNALPKVLYFYIIYYSCLCKSLLKHKK